MRRMERETENWVCGGRRMLKMKKGRSYVCGDQELHVCTYARKVIFVKACYVLVFRKKGRETVTVVKASFGKTPFTRFFFKFQLYHMECDIF